MTLCFHKRSRALNWAGTSELGTLAQVTCPVFLKLWPPSGLQGSEVTEFGGLWSQLQISNTRGWFCVSHQAEPRGESLRTCRDSFYASGVSQDRDGVKPRDHSEGHKLVAGDCESPL